MPRDTSLKRVIVIGSGPIIIGQAAEFDYAGTQACRSLREEGIEVVLVNSNPATIMTDTNMADAVYIEPLTVEFLERVIAAERPDGLLPTLGGQTGLNLAAQLAEAGVLDRYGVRLLGTQLDAIHRAEDREAFKTTMEEIGEPVPPSAIVESLDDALAFAGEVGYPLIVRPAYTLGGTGGGIAEDDQSMRDIVMRGLHMSMIGQVLLERCLIGWKEIEYEVMRDGSDSCITVCNMENLDPMGIHTGDSIVIAPSQTLSDKEYQMLRSASLNIIRSLRIEGGCNVQLALDPNSMDYFVIEVNPRVSRSSALASKATGYPIARVAAKIAVGLHLDEIENAVTKKTLACFEPALDYCVVKIPRWPFDKFLHSDRTIGTQMKATGEVMAIDRTFEAALMKALRSLEIGVTGFDARGVDQYSDMRIENLLRVATDERLFVVADAFRRGMLLAEVQDLSSIDPWFLEKIQGLVQMEQQLRETSEEELTPDLLRAAKRHGFSDRQIGALTGLREEDVRARRRAHDITPTYKMVDTCAAEFEAATPYYYSTYETESEVKSSDRPRIVVLGSGPIRIGQGIEFDYCSVHAVWALQECGYESIIINNNPETVSTDFDTADRLYFEPLTAEDCLNVIEAEQPEGIIVQFGGQTAINLTEPLVRGGARILGTSLESIDIAEDRDRFDHLLRDLNIPKPPGRAVTSVEAAVEVATEIGYPVLVRPSFVLGGRAMEIVYDEEELLSYMKYAVDVSPRRPILVDKYVLGKEVEVDVIADGKDMLIVGIMEHVERAGVHSGDSMAVYPPQDVTAAVAAEVERHTAALARALQIKGIMNIQYVLDGDQLYIIEVNPRASRTVPYLSKITGVPMVKVGTKVMLGHSLAEQGYEHGIYPVSDAVAIKAPVFSFAKLTAVDIHLGPEMKSTGEIMGINGSFPGALYKAMVSAGFDIPPTGSLLVTVADRDKADAVEIVRGFAELGYKVYATRGTHQYLTERGIVSEMVYKLHEQRPNLLDLVLDKKVDLVINTMTNRRTTEQDGIQIRRASVEHSVPCLTSLDTAKALLTAVQTRAAETRVDCRPLHEYADHNGRHSSAVAADGSAD